MNIYHVSIECGRKNGSKLAILVKIHVQWKACIRLQVILIIFNSLQIRSASAEPKRKIENHTFIIFLTIRSTRSRTFGTSKPSGQDGKCHQERPGPAGPKHRTILSAPPGTGPIETWTSVIQTHQVKTISCAKMVIKIVNIIVCKH